MNIKALIFDVDGTMADNEETHRQAFNAAFIEHGLGWDWSRERYRELLQVSGGKERLAAFIDTLQEQPAEKARLRQLVPLIHGTKTRIYNELIDNGGVRLRPGVKRLVREAHAAGVRLAIASTTTPANVTSLLKVQFGTSDYHWFTVLACGDMVKAKKPAPDIYLLALSMLGLAADECVAFEDSVNGLAAAKAAGLYTVVTPNIWSYGGDFSGADLLLPGLGDPEIPLDSASAKRVGASQLGIAELERLHAAAGRRVAA